MARVKLTLPSHFGFKTQLPVRIQDINYGGHVGNDSILSIIHEARLRFLDSHGFKEYDPSGAGLVMTDVAIVYKGEGFYGDLFDVEVAAAEFSPFGFDLYYRITTQRQGSTILIAEAKTGMVSFDYQQRKMVRLPEEWKQQLEVTA